MMMNIDPIADKLKLSITRFCTALCNNRFWKLSAGKLAACAALAVVVVFSCAFLVVSGIDSSVTTEERESETVNIAEEAPKEEEPDEMITGAAGYWRKADISEYNRPLQAIAVEKEEQEEKPEESESVAPEKEETETAESTADAEIVEEAPAEEETPAVTEDGLPVNVEAEDDGEDEVLEDDEDDVFDSRVLVALSAIDLRSEPDDASYIMDMIPAFSEVEVKELCEGGEWYTVIFNGMDGYVRVSELSAAE